MAIVAPMRIRAAAASTMADGLPHPPSNEPEKLLLSATPLHEEDHQGERKADGEHGPGEAVHVIAPAIVGGLPVPPREKSSALRGVTTPTRPRRSLAVPGPFFLGMEAVCPPVESP
jgi:hypothetical protein